MYGHPERGYLMPLSDTDKQSLAALVKQYNKFTKSAFPLPSDVLRVSSQIINLLAVAAGVIVESE